MFTHKLVPLIAAVAIFGGGISANAQGSTSSRSSMVASTAQKIKITASQYAFAPSSITVHVGKPVTLDLTSTDVTHGIASTDLGIPGTSILKGKNSTVTFTPKKVGTYTVHCSVFCGVGHADMKLTVRVVP